MKYKLLFLFVTLFLVSCGITDFEMPSWDVKLTCIPLMNEDYPASDLIGDNIIAEDGYLFAFVEDGLEEATPILDKHITDSTPPIQLLSNQTFPINFEIHSIATNTAFRITEGKFESGEMSISYDGDFTDITMLNLTFNQLYYDDQVVQLGLTPEDFTNNQYILDLANVTIKDQNINGEFWIINIAVTAMSSLPEGSLLGKITISIDDLVVFSEFTGFIDDIRALDSETNVEITYPNNIENTVILDQISMHFYIENEIGFNFELNGDLVAYRDELEIDRINIQNDTTIDFTINADTTYGDGVLTTIDVVDDVRINLMLRKMPDKIAFLNPVYRVNNIDETMPGFISNQHKINCRYEIEVPLRATYSDAHFIYPDKVFDVEISADNQKLIDEKVEEAEIILTLINGYPIGGVIDLYLSSQELTAESTSLAQAELIFSNYDLAVTGNPQKHILKLESGDFQVFKNDRIYIMTRVKFHNSEEPVSIMEADNLNIKGSLNVVVKIEGV
ncbi:MAG: hypothetical protein WC155_01140 [Candidatus Cloacimonadales bacterium]